MNNMTDDESIKKTPKKKSTTIRIPIEKYPDYKKELREKEISSITDETGMTSLEKKTKYSKTHYGIKNNNIMTISSKLLRKFTKTCTVNGREPWRYVKL